MNKQNNTEYVSYWIRRYMMDYLPCVQRVAANTIKSYRDCYRLLMPVIAADVKCSCNNIKVVDITPDRVKMLLENIESVRKCSVQTRNVRLSAIKALAKYVSMNAPEYLEWCRQIHSIPVKKHMKTIITYLSKNEMDALLDAPDTNSLNGRRNRALLMFMYNTGTRASETVSVRKKDIQIKKNGYSTVCITGKGNKERVCPVWDETIELLRELLEGKEDDDYIFINQRGEPMTRYGVYEMMKKYAKEIETSYPTIRKKRLTPHTIRHTTATHLLQSGVDINTIRAWLGHVSVNTTNIYAEVDMVAKMKALENCKPNIKQLKNKKRFNEDKDLMEFLNSL